MHRNSKHLATSPSIETFLPRDQSGSFPKTNGPSRPIYNGGKDRARSETRAIVAWVNSESAFKSATEGAGASEAYRRRSKRKRPSPSLSRSYFFSRYFLGRSKIGISQKFEELLNH
jgi:hypothetical protein